MLNEQKLNLEELHCRNVDAVYKAVVATNKEMPEAQGLPEAACKQKANRIIRESWLRAGKEVVEIRMAVTLACATAAVAAGAVASCISNVSDGMVVTASIATILAAFGGSAVMAIRHNASNISQYTDDYELNGEAPENRAVYKRAQKILDAYIKRNTSKSALG